MKLQFINSQYNNNMLKTKRQTLEQSKLKEQTKLGKEYSENRPAQANSFSGSAISFGKNLGYSLLESKFLNSVIGGVNKNEALFNAIFALIIAGILKPALVLKQTGHNDKDGQMIATKNFLQAFIGFFLGTTISGGFVKKIYDTMITDLSLIDVTKNDNKITLSAKSVDDKKVRDIAKGKIKKEHSNFSAKWSYASKTAKEQPNIIEKIKVFTNSFKKYKYKPSDKEITQKAAQIMDSFKESGRLSIFKRNPAFSAKLIENIKLIEDNPITAREMVKNGSQISEAFESFWKNITGAPVAITKAMIASALLPVVVYAIFSQQNTKKSAEKEQSVSKIQKNDNKYKNFDKVLNSKNKQPSFKGSFLNKLIAISSKGVEKIAVTKPLQTITEGISKISETPSFFMSNIESFGITGYWLLNTHFSKKIDPDQKLGLNTHTALVTIVSSTLAYIIDTCSKGIINKAEINYLNKVLDVAKEAKANAKIGTSTKELSNEIISKCSKLYNSEAISSLLKENSEIIMNDKAFKSEIEKLACTYGKHLKKFKSLTIFAIVVRFMVPVAMVKISKELKKFLVEISKDYARKKQERQIINSRKAF